MALLLLVLALADTDAELDRALGLRDSFETAAAASLLEEALARDGNDGPRAAQRMWHLGVLHSEARASERARESFARAAATDHPPALRVEVSPEIQGLIDAAWAERESSKAAAGAPATTTEQGELQDAAPIGSGPIEAADVSAPPASEPAWAWLAAGGGAALLGIVGVVAGVTLVASGASVLADPTTLRVDKDGAETLAVLGGVTTGLGAATTLVGGGLLVMGAVE